MNTLAFLSRISFPVTRQAIRALKTELTLFFETMGQVTLFQAQLFRYGLQREWSLRHILEQFAFVGVDTMPIALVMTTFTAMVISLQVSSQMVHMGASAWVGALVSLAMIRELAPIMTAFSIIAMAGSAFTAELSTMNISSQVNALQTLHIDPVRYLAAPRILGGTLALPVMTVVTAAVSLAGGLLIAVLVGGVTPDQYMTSVQKQITIRDLVLMLLKSGLFGLVICSLATVIGLNTKGGAREVGLATTRTVVTAFIMLAIMDYLFTSVFYGSTAST